MSISQKLSSTQALTRGLSVWTTECRFLCNDGWGDGNSFVKFVQIRESPGQHLYARRGSVQGWLKFCRFVLECSWVLDYTTQMVPEVVGLSVRFPLCYLSGKTSHFCSRCGQSPLDKLTSGSVEVSSVERIDPLTRRGNLSFFRMTNKINQIKTLKGE